MRARLLASVSLVSVSLASAAACGIDALGLATSSEPDASADAAVDDAPGGDGAPRPDPFADGATAADAGPLLDAAPGDAGCSSTRGPTMVGVAAAGLSYCIDGTEVTEAQWASFLAADAGAQILPGACAGKAAYSAGSARGAMRPVGSVDWCDAWAFCAWAGKRLCSANEWQTACTGGTTRVYPYGDTFDGSTCNGSQFGEPTDVGSLAGCRGPIPGIFDMSGNIDEWIASCSADVSLADICQTRGGDYSGDPPGELTCASTYARTRSAIITYVGFRCCR